MGVFENNYRYKITESGLVENRSFRGKVERWLDGSLLGGVSWTKEGEVLAVFARYPGTALSLNNLWDKTELLPGMIESTVRVLQDRGLIERVYEPGKALYSSVRGHPETYGDWVDISDGIKSRAPSLSNTVNGYMLDIMNETEGMSSAKNWLAEKARELGII